MADFEEKLNAILSSPESMQQVAQLAQMLSAQNAAEVPTDEETQMCIRDSSMGKFCKSDPPVSVGW